MTLQPDKPEQIAEKLTEVQRDLLAKLPQRPSLINGAPGRALYRKGLATLGRKDGRLIATKDGLSVRKALLKEGRQ